MNVTEYLEKKGIYYTLQNRPSGEQAVLECPNCHDKNSFAISTTTGAYNCLRQNNCGITGNFYSFQKLLGDEPKYRPAASFIGKTEKVYVKPKISEIYEPSGKWADWLLNDRKIPENIVKKFRLHVSKDGRLGFVYRNEKDEIVNIKWRTFDKKFSQEKDAEPTLYGRDLVPNSTTELIICEGEMDAMAWTAYGYNAVSIPSGAKDTRWIENDYEWLERFQKVFISMDMDEAGQSQVYKLASRIGTWRAKSIQLPYKDANSCLVNGVSPDQILDSLLHAHEFKMPGLENPNAYEDELIQLIENPEYMNGVSTNFKNIDDILKGWRNGESTVWTGKNGTGKTTFLNQVVMSAMAHHGMKCGIISLEIKPVRLLKWMLNQSGLPQTREGVRKFMDAFNEHLFLVDIQGEVDPDNMFSILEYATKKHGVKMWVVDSIGRVAMYGNNELQLQRQFMNRLTSFAREHDIHVHLVAHPRKQYSHVKNSILTKDDIGGSGVITDLAHNVMIMHRLDREEDEDTINIIKNKYGIEDVELIIKIAKNREHGDTGNTYFYFDRFKKIYLPAKKKASF